MGGSAITRLVCAPWAGINDLPEKRPELTDDEWDDLLWQASETLYSFTGRQFSGGCESYAILDDDEPGSRAGGAPADRYAGSGVYGYGLGRGRPRRGRAVVMLPGYPITDLLEVTVDDVPLPAGSFRASLPLGKVWPRSGRPWPGDGSVGFRYRHGIPPPIGGRRSAVVLALEFGKSWSSDKAWQAGCRLPKRVESIQREGLTISMLNTFQMIGEGRTGLYDVDLWIRETNKDRLSSPPSVWSPDVRRATRSTA